MAETATVGLSQRDETTLRRHTLGCRISDTYIEPLMPGPWKAMTEFEFEGNSCLLADARVPAETLKKISELPVDKTDIFVTSFPKSGTTWVQEIVFLIHTDLDFEKSADQTMNDRFPFIEYRVEGVAESASPRLIKSHLPYEFLPNHAKEGKCKVFHVARNPRDVCVSYFHFGRMMNSIDFQGSFKDYFERFTSGKVMFGPWTTNVLSYWKHRHQANILFLTYEELMKDPGVVVMQIATFLGKTLDQAQMQKIVDHCSFKNMQNNPTANYSWLQDLGFANNKTAFLRKGEVGDWENYFDAKMCEEMDKACGDNVKAEGLKFVYKL